MVDIGGSRQQMTSLDERGKLKAWLMERKQTNRQTKTKKLKI